MIAIITTLLANPYVQGVLVAGGSWVGAKVVKLFGDSKAGKLASTLATAVGLMTQYALTEGADKTAAQMVIAFKGIVAITFAKAGYTEKQRLAFQVVIDVAINKAVTEWVKLHPAPATLTMPITKTLEASFAKLAVA